MDAREVAARVLGAGLAVAAMATAWRNLGWPAPALSCMLGFAAYQLARKGAR